MPKYRLLVCHACGAEKKILIYSSKEIRDEGRRPVPPRCEQCGSQQVTLHD